MYESEWVGGQRGLETSLRLFLDKLNYFLDKPNEALHARVPRASDAS
jgi:hypothetical protein